MRQGPRSARQNGYCSCHGTGIKAVIDMFGILTNQDFNIHLVV